MSDSIFLIGDDGSLTEAHGAPYGTEDELQALLAGHIDLLPGAQINRDSPRRWLLIKREAGIPDREGGGAWFSVDHLAVDQDAIPTFIEVKRASDTRARREVVAQMLDYAANGSVFWTSGQMRGWFEGRDPDAATGRLADFLDVSDGDPGDVADAFWQAVGTNLREGHLRLVFVADEIPASLQRLVEFLNEQMPRVEVLAVEIQQYRADGSGTGALVSRLVGQTSRAQAAKEPPAATAATALRPVPWTVSEVLALVAERAGEDATAVAAAVSDWADRHHHIRIEGGRGQKDPSFTMRADLGPGRKPVGVLAPYLSGANPLLEIRIKDMLGPPPYDRAEERARLTTDLQALGIPTLEAGGVFDSKARPGIPMSELTGGRAERLLAVIDRWVHNVRAHGGEAGAAEENTPAHPDT